MGPCLSLQPPKTGALLGSTLQSWYTACSSTAKILLPAHSVATDSLYITVAVSPHSPHFYVLLVKNTVWIVLYLPICWSDEISPHLAHQHTCTRTYWDQLEGLGRGGVGSIVCLSAKNAEESLPSRGGQGALSNRLCSDAAFGTRRPAPLMQVQGWLSSCQTDLVLCC